MADRPPSTVAVLAVLEPRAHSIAAGHTSPGDAAMHARLMAAGLALALAVLLLLCPAPVSAQVTPTEIMAPVTGDLEVVSSDLACGGAVWCFNQHGTGLHGLAQGVGRANDTYAWDANLNMPVHDSDNGKPVYAVEAGVVPATYADALNCGGSYGQVLVQHAWGGGAWWSGYLHLADIQVSPGDLVQRGTLLGYVSHTSPDPIPIPNHLHFVAYTGANVAGGLVSFDATITPRAPSPVTPSVTLVPNLPQLSGSVADPVAYRATVSNPAPGTLNYTFWWNCADPGVAVDQLSIASVCGDPTNPAIGAKYDGTAANPFTATHTYPEAGTYTAKVVAETGSYALESRAEVSLTPAPAPITVSLACDLPELSTFIGDPIACTASVPTPWPGTFNYTFWWDCSDPGTAVDQVASAGACGDPTNPDTGAKVDGTTANPLVVSYAYSTAGTHTVKVIAENGPYAAESRLQVAAVSEPDPMSGVIQVGLAPDETVAAGAQWRLSTQSTWNHSGALIQGLARGTYQVQLRPIAGWLTPPDQQVSVTRVQPEISITVEPYTPSSLTVSLSVRSANPASGVYIDVSPTDTGGQIGGATPFECIYPINATVTLTAPTATGTHSFSGWQPSSGELTSGQNATVTLANASTMTAVFTATAAPQVTALQWRSKADMPVQRYGALTAVYNGMIHVIGGNSLVSHLRYDPAADSWSVLTGPPSPGVSSQAGAATIGGRVYCLYDQTLRVYDATTDAWSTGAPMPTLRASPAVVSVHGKVYVIGGLGGSLNGVNTVEAYDPTTNTWAAAAPMPTPRGLAAAAVVDNLVYVIGGRAANVSPTDEIAAVEVYDPVLDRWSSRREMPTPRWSALACLLGGRIYVLGGYSNYANIFGCSDKVEEYDPATDRWRTVIPLSTPRASATGAVVGDRFYIAGGQNDAGFLASTEEGTPTLVPVGPITLPPSLASGAVRPNTATDSPLNVGNPGAAELTVTSVTVDGPDAADFAVSLRTFTVPAGGTQVLTVIFKPSSPGPKAATLWVYHNASTGSGSPALVTLSGTGVDVAPATPTGLLGIPGAGHVQLSWDPSPDTDLSHYVLYRSSQQFSVGDSVARVSPPALTFADAGLVGGPFYYRVRAVDAAGNRSDVSDQVTVTLNFGSGTPLWWFPIHVATHDGIAGTLTMGVVEGAREGVDTWLGEEEMPPRAPEFMYDFRWEVGGMYGLTVEYRGTDVMHTGSVWDLALQVDGDNVPAVIHWDPGMLPAEGAFRLVDAPTGGLVVDVDMRRDDEHQVTDPGLAVLQVRYHPAMVITYTYNLPAKWSMVSLPCEVPDPRVAPVFPNAITLWRFSGAYAMASSLEPGVGYWINLPAATQVTVTGPAHPSEALQLSLPSRWSMVGPGAVPLDVSALKTAYPSLISVFGYSSGYYVPSTMGPGQAYWVNLGSAQALDLSGAVVPAGPAKPLAALPGPPEAVGPSLWVEGPGGSQAIRLGVAPDEIVELPPVPPVELFDVRVEVGETGTWAVPAGGEGQQYRLRVQGGVDRLRWSVPPETWGQWALQVGAHRELLVGSGTMALPEGAQVWVEPTGGMPGAYALWPSYPNPFNPETTIGYEVPVAGPVQLSVYAMTGQRVRQLVASEQTAGRYQVSWDGRDDHGASVSSGVYLSELRVGEYHAVRKMMLLR